MSRPAPAPAPLPRSPGSPKSTSASGYASLCAASLHRSTLRCLATIYRPSQSYGYPLCLLSSSAPLTPPTAGLPSVPPCCTLQIPRFPLRRARLPPARTCQTGIPFLAPACPLPSCFPIHIRSLDTDPPRRRSFQPPLLLGTVRLQYTCSLSHIRLCSLPLSGSRLHYMCTHSSSHPCCLSASADRSYTRMSRSARPPALSRLAGSRCSSALCSALRLRSPSAAPAPLTPSGLLALCSCSLCSSCSRSRPQAA